MIVTHVNYDSTEITAFIRSGDYLWVAFAAVDGVCVISKVYANDMTQVYFSVSVQANRVKQLAISNGSVVALLDSASYVLAYFADTNPLLGVTYTLRSSGSSYVPTILWADDDICAVGFNSELEPSRLSFYSLYTFTLDSTLELNETGSQIFNLSAITKGGTTLWLATEEATSRLIRVPSPYTEYFVTALG